MKKLISKSIAIAVSGMIVCSVLSACVKKPVDGAEATPIASLAPGASETPYAGSETPLPADVTGAPQQTQSAETNYPVPTATPSAPTQPPSATPTPAQSGTVSIGTSSMPARFTMPTDLYGLSPQMCENWFSDAVFVGDSITKGWKQYNNLMLENDPSFFGQTHVLCEGSYGSGHALEPISENSVHPIYAGEQHYIWDSIRMMGAKKVFILFGMNDLTQYGVDGAVEKYSQVLDRILETNPGIQLYIISAMYMYRGSEKPVLNNSNLYLYNQRIVELCASKGAEFVNIASHLIDENGFVPDEYSSDQYVHQTYEAYAVWADVLRSLAARHLKGMPPVVFSLPQ